jgi:DNA-binding protein YbaB
MSKTTKTNATMQELMGQYELSKTQMNDDKTALQAAEKEIAKEERLLQIQWGGRPKALKQQFDISLEDAREHCLKDLLVLENNPTADKIRELKKQHAELLARFRFGEIQVQILEWEIAYILKTVESENKKIRVLQIS